MTPEKIKEAIAKAIYCHKGHLPAPWDCAGDAGESDWKQLRMEAESQAAAVMALVGPKPLVWSDRGGAYWAAEIASGMAYITEYAGMEHPFKLDCGGWYTHHHTLEAAQAAAQSHADAAHWANTALGGTND